MTSGGGSLITASVAVLSACSGSKAGEPVVDCAAIDGASRAALLERYRHVASEARTLYTGAEHAYVAAAVERLQVLAEVDWRIVSAGFGLVGPGTPLPPYECTFRDADSVRERVAGFGHDPEALTQAEQLRVLAEELGVIDDVRAWLDRGFDLVFVLLGKAYLQAVEPALEGVPEGTAAFAFAPKGNRELIGDCAWVPATDTERAAVGTTWTRLKGEQFWNLACAVSSPGELAGLEAGRIRDLSVEDAGIEPPGVG